METKKFYQSKLFWLGIIQTLIGFCSVLADFFATGVYSPEAITLLISGALTIVLRVFFTSTTIE